MDNGQFSVHPVTNTHISSTLRYGHWLPAHCLCSCHDHICASCRHCTLFKLWHISMQVNTILYLKETVNKMALPTSSPGIVHYRKWAGRPYHFFKRKSPRDDYLIFLSPSFFPCLNLGPASGLPLNKVLCLLSSQVSLPWLFAAVIVPTLLLVVCFQLIFI